MHSEFLGNLPFYVAILLLSTSTIVFLVLFLEKVKAYRKLLKKNLYQHHQDKPFILVDEVDFSTINSCERKEEKLLKDLQKLFEEEKIYLDQDVSIGSLSKLLGTNTDNLSRLINANLNISFPTLLNDYRINEAIRLLQDKKNIDYKIDIISDMCGYKNRQVFHYTFKKKMGLTPNHFRKISHSDISKFS